MHLHINPDRAEWPALLRRPVMDFAGLEARVAPILAEVRDRGDAALRAFTARFDGVDLDDLAVSPADMAQAERELSESLRAAIALAARNIRAFHQAQATPELRVETMPGVHCWRRSMPIERVGLYIPGGTAPLFSTILMLAIPAQVAGCKELVLCTPPGKDGRVHPAIRYAAHLSGITQLFRVGGAQAIAALAYGTESIPQVYKIFGPGNQYVTLAKQLVSREGVAIDMPAGPSEVAVVADATAQPAFLAADLLSQAEHGIDSQVLLVTTAPGIAEATQIEVERQLASLPRKDIAREALSHSRVLVLRDEDEAVDLINAYAPEHLILAVKNDEALADRIVNAGSIFLGHYTPESVGDYASGTNHTLPTNGFARAYSGVSLDSFVKKITYQKLSPEGLQRLGPAVEEMATAEELVAHRQAVSIRLAALKQDSD
ncbi:MAG: histidinol dehydrogenase [Bacteroidetes bacterium]|nr:MAG: histidinol dehydrogenase [Bacteroidota bacterium]